MSVMIVSDHIFLDASSILGAPDNRRAASNSVALIASEVSCVWMSGRRKPRSMPFFR
jgi:hypothetical protein